VRLVLKLPSLFHRDGPLEPPDEGLFFPNEKSMAVYLACSAADGRHDATALPAQAAALWDPCEKDR
jgi:hypothetical protein